MNVSKFARLQSSSFNSSNVTPLGPRAVLGLSSVSRCAESARRRAEEAAPGEGDEGKERSAALAWASEASSCREPVQRSGRFIRSQRRAEVGCHLRIIRFLDLHQQMETFVALLPFLSSLGFTTSCPSSTQQAPLPPASPAYKPPVPLTCQREVRVGRYERRRHARLQRHGAADDRPCLLQQLACRCGAWNISSSSSSSSGEERVRQALAKNCACGTLIDAAACFLLSSVNRPNPQRPQSHLPPCFCSTPLPTASVPHQHNH